MEEAPVVLSIENVRKKYVIKNQIKSEKQPKNKVEALFNRKKIQKTDFWALNGVNIQVKKGEKVGIIGKNGAGKSTLLKIISRITEPTDGRIEILGRVSSMLEVGTGFNAELTGRENVYLNGAILGMTKAEIDAKFDEILEFSEVGKFIDTPVKRYSSGMFVRLAFAVASTLQSDIMLVDEVLAVGDTKFQRKCINRMKEIAESGRTILFVSHQMNIIRQLCDRVIVLKEGKNIYDGDVEGGIRIYNSETYMEKQNHYEFEDMRKDSVKRNEMVLKSMDVLRNTSCIYAYDEPLEFKLTAEAFVKDIGDISLRVMFWRDGDTPVGIAFSKIFANIKEPGTYEFNVKIPEHNLGPGLYTCVFNLSKGSSKENYDYLDYIEGAFPFEVLHFDGTGRSWARQWGNVRNENIEITLADK